jgi:hypothetical protein
MQLRLASILALTALGVCAVSQADWKPYSVADLRAAVTSADEPGSGTLLADILKGRLFSRIFSASKPNRTEALASRTDVNRAPKVRNTSDRRDYGVVGQRESKQPDGSTLAMAGHAARAVAWVDEIGRSVTFHLPSHSPVQLVARTRGKVKVIEPEKFFKNLNFSDFVTSELRKELLRVQRDAQREECTDREDSKRDADAESTANPGSEQVERFDSRP